MSKRVILMLVIVLGFILMLSGCKSLGIKNQLADQTLKLTFMLSDEVSNITPQTVSDEIQLDKYVVTITKGTVQHIKETPVVNNGGEVVFTGIESGDWSISVIAKDVDGFDCYAGQTVGTVLNGLTVVNVDLYLLNGDLDVTVILPVIQGTSINSGTVRLVNPRYGAQHIDLPLMLQGSQAVADFGSVLAGTWYIEAELFDPAGVKIAWGSAVITVLPSRENHALIEFGGNLEGGDLKVVITTHLSPSDPTGVTAKVVNGQIVLSWNANPESNIVGYTVYRATSLEGFKKILTYSLINTTSYTDTTVELDKTYYYWVQAYNSDNYASDLSDVCTVTVNNGHDLTKYASVIYVDAQIGDDVAGDGSALKPYRSIDIAYTKLSPDSALVIQPGVYEINPFISSDNVHTSIFNDYVDFNYDILGSGKDTVLNMRNSKNPTSRGYHLFYNMGRSGATINVYGLNIKWWSEGEIGSTVDADNSIFDHCGPNVSFYNIAVEVMDNYTVSYCWNNAYTDTPKVYNSMFDLYNTVADYSGQAQYINCLFNKTPLNGTKQSCLTRVITLNDYDFAAADLLNKGTGFNEDGSIAHIGVYGGLYSW